MLNVYSDHFFDLEWGQLKSSSTCSANRGATIVCGGRLGSRVVTGGKREARQLAKGPVLTSPAGVSMYCTIINDSM